MATTTKKFLIALVRSFVRPFARSLARSVFRSFGAFFRPSVGRSVAMVARSQRRNRVRLSSGSGTTREADLRARRARLLLRLTACLSVCPIESHPSSRRVINRARILK